MKRFLLLSVFLFSCGPDWGDCHVCGTGPVTEVAPDSGTPTTPPDVGEPDAGCSTPDAGIPVKVCVAICTCHVTKWECTNGGKYDYYPRGCGTCKEVTVCTQTEEVCR